MMMPKILAIMIPIARYEEVSKAIWMLIPNNKVSKCAAHTSHIPLIKITRITAINFLLEGPSYKNEQIRKQTEAINTILIKL